MRVWGLLSFEQSHRGHTLCRRLQQTLGVINDTSDILLRVNRHISAEVEVMMTFSMTTTLSMARILLTK